MRPLTRALALASTGAVALALTAGPAQAATTLNPTKLTRGADSTIAHLEGKTLVDGTFRVALEGAGITLLGESGTGYVVVTSDRQGRGTMVRVDASGATRSFGQADQYSSVLSSDGTIALAVRFKRSGEMIVKAIDATTGQVTASRAFDDYPSVLDAQGTRVLLGGFSGKTKGTYTWDTATGAVTKLSRRVGALADAQHDLLVTYTKDPYSDGCTVLSRLSNPLVKLWKSCDDTIAAISTDGSHLVTYDILTDGLGAGTVRVRTTNGAVTGEYEVKRNGYFDTLQFEDADTLLLDVTVGRKGATVRCTASTCDLASDVKRVDPYRAAA